MLLRCFVCIEVLWKTERPLKYETTRPLSAVITMKQRPPIVRRNVRSAAVRRPRRTADLLTSHRPDVTGDHVTGHKLTTTPDNSDAEDGGKNRQRDVAWKWKGAESAGKYEDKKKNVRTAEEKMSNGMESWKTRAPECADGFEKGTRKAKVMEDKFKQQVLQLQQQLGLTSEGFVLPS